MTDIYSHRARFKAGILAGLGLVFMVGLIVALSVLYVSMLEPIGPSYRGGVDMLIDMRRGIFCRALIVFGITSLVMAVGIVALAMLYSHRLAGPLYHLTRFVKALAEGHFDSLVRLRAKDAIHPVAGELNEMVEVYRKNLKEIKQEVDSLGDMAAGLDHGEVGLEELGEKAAKIHHLASIYRLAD